MYAINIGRDVLIVFIVVFQIFIILKIMILSKLNCCKFMFKLNLNCYKGLAVKNVLSLKYNIEKKVIYMYIQLILYKKC